MLKGLYSVCTVARLTHVKGSVLCVYCKHDLHMLKGLYSVYSRHGLHMLKGLYSVCTVSTTYTC